LKELHIVENEIENKTFKIHSAELTAVRYLSYFAIRKERNIQNYLLFYKIVC